MRLTQMIEMNAASMAYSIRSCPASSQNSCFSNAIIVGFLLPSDSPEARLPALMPGGPGPPSIDSWPGLRRAARNRGDLGVDVVVNAVDARAHALDRGHRHQR